LNQLDRLMRWPSGASNSEKLYGAIVAQARLPIFYRSFGVPDTLQGRFAVLSLHLFAALHRLKEEGPEGRALAQELIDRFSQDMETVLRAWGERSAHPEVDAGACRIKPRLAAGL
jgi:cytochrome b pre-mRNA-processing protein 3